MAKCPTPGKIISLELGIADAMFLVWPHRIAALAGIDSADNLRLLAREQRLALPAHVSSTQELRAAIVTATERRIANRMAAAS